MSQTTTSLRPLGVCWVVYGVLRLAVAIGLVLYFGTSTVMFGALLSRVANPFSLMDLFHILYVLAIGWCVIGGLLAILAGIALTGDNRTTRGPIVPAAALLALPDSPLGVMLGTYTLIIFLPRSSSVPG